LAIERLSTGGTVRTRFYTLLSSLLILGGGVLLFLGGREFVESRVGQSEAAREFHESDRSTGPKRPHRPLPVRPGETMAKLIIPRLETELYVVEGDDAGDLRRGPGHLPGTALPGADGNCVIAGHRDTHFRVLKDIKAGDEIVLETPLGKFLYRVQYTRVVSPTNTSSLKPTTDAVLNLITCYPFYYVGSAPKRFIVEARLAGMVPRTS
jgi:sortase A